MVVFKSLSNPFEHLLCSDLDLLIDYDEGLEIKVAEDEKGNCIVGVNKRSIEVAYVPLINSKPRESDHKVVSFHAQDGVVGVSLTNGYRYKIHTIPEILPQNLEYKVYKYESYVFSPRNLEAYGLDKLN